MGQFKWHAEWNFFAVIIALQFVFWLWPWLKRRRSRDWPVAQGGIESTSVGPAKLFGAGSFTRDKSDRYSAEIAYSYSVDGERYSGRYAQNFTDEDEAEEFVRDLQGKPVAIRFNSRKPSKSALVEEELATIQQNRPPAPLTSVVKNRIPDWARPLIWPLVALAAAGLAVSIWVHVNALFGRRVLPQEFFGAMHAGIFVVFFPGILLTKASGIKTNRKDFWKNGTPGVPKRLGYLLYFLVVYAMINFAIFWLQAPVGKQFGNEIPIQEWRGFSGHWMLFYCAAMTMLWSAASAASGPHCLNGHPAAEGETVCQRCGQAVQTQG
jgi:hypothetical protein